MDSLVGYGSDDDNDYDRHGSQQISVSSGREGGKSKEEDANYDDVNMDLSEESESEPELPPAEPPASDKRSKQVRRGSDEHRDRERDGDKRDRNVEKRDIVERRDRETDRRDRDGDKRDRRRESPRPKDKHRRDDRSDKDRNDRRGEGPSRRGLLGDRPVDKPDKVPSLMDVKTFGGEGPPSHSRSHDARDAVSPRFVERDRRDKERERERDRDKHSRRSEEKRFVERDRRDKERERERDRDKHSRRSEEKRSGHRRDRSRGAVYPPPEINRNYTSSERRGSPSTGGDYRPSSYKVNKKLEVMEKMGLQIKTPDGSMATAQQLRAAAIPPYYNPTGVNSNKILEQVQKRKLLWGNKSKNTNEEAGKWTGTRFAQDSDGKQANKFMRLMGIKDPAAVGGTAAEPAADPIRKQEELFQAMQAQYEVARATTHTMRGVGLGFSRTQL